MEGTDFLNSLGIKMKSNESYKRELNSWMGESVLDPAHKKLSNEIWSEDGEKIKKENKKFILDNFYKWVDKIGLDKDKIGKIVVVGSTTTFQYTDNSDIDVNIIIDLSDDKIREYGRMLPNGNNLPGTKHPVNYYLSNDEKQFEVKQAIYDLNKDKWVKKAKLSDVKVPYSYVLEIAKFFMDGIDERIQAYERTQMELEIYKTYLKEKDDINVDPDHIQKMISHKELQSKATLDAIHVAHKLAKSFRKKAFEDDYEPDFLINIEAKNPDFSVNNMVYKELERFGYLERLDKYEKIRDKVLDKKEE
jgi:predicted nucleotidyltransferase